GGVFNAVPRKLKQGGLKIDLVPPTTNTLNVAADVYIANNSHALATLWLSAADLTASTATESVGAIRINGTGSATIPVNKATLESIFGVGATIVIYATWTNEFGVSAFSVGNNYSLATGETSAVSLNSGVPSGGTFQAIPRKLKQGGFKIDLVAPTTNNNNLVADVYIANNSHALATLWLSAADLTTSTATESVGAIRETPAGGITIPVNKATLESIFGVGATIVIYATWTNEFGVSAFSGGNNYSLATGEVGALSPNVAVPAGLSAPAPKKLKQGGFKIDLVAPTTNNNNLVAD